MKIIITSIGLDFDPSEKDDSPVIHYDVMNGSTKIGHSMKAISRIDAEGILGVLDSRKKEIEKEINQSQ